MVGDQALRLVDPLDQLAHPEIAPGQRGQELPPHRVGCQPDEGRRRHAGKIHQLGLMNQLVLIDCAGRENARMTHVARLSLATGSVLMLATGFVDAYTFLQHGHVFAQAMTGNLVLVAIGAFEPSIVAFWRPLVPYAAFMVGVAVVWGWSRRRGTPAPQLATLGLLVGVLVVVGFLPGGHAVRRGHGRDRVRRGDADRGVPRRRPGGVHHHGDDDELDEDGERRAHRADLGRPRGPGRRPLVRHGAGRVRGGRFPRRVPHDAGGASGRRGSTPRCSPSRPGCTPPNAALRLPARAVAASQLGVGPGWNVEERRTHGCASTAGGRRARQCPVATLAPAPPRRRTTGCASTCGRVVGGLARRRRAWLRSGSGRRCRPGGSTAPPRGRRGSAGS